MVENVSGHSCLTRQAALLSSLKDVTPFELGEAATHLRRFFSSMQFREMVLHPFDAYPMDYQDAVLDVPSIGQLRFNTEPEIWGGGKLPERFYSISSLFRKEKEKNLLRRSAFFIVDFYQPGPPDSMLPIFHALLQQLAEAGFGEHLHRLPFDYAEYDPVADCPRLSSFETRWVVTKGYDAAHSFFEVDERGASTRNEVFLVTPLGYLEIGAFGITGLNKNPRYIFRTGAASLPMPPVHRSGMGLGFERLLLADRILSILLG